MHRFLHLDQCFSTQDEILKLLNEDEPSVVFTFNQTQGRGQYGNSWQVIPDQNLAYSFGIKVSEIKVSAVLLNYYTAIVVRDFLDNLTHSDVKIKWPNDIILNGKKVCGMLIEKKRINEVDYFIIGVGINVLQTDFSQLPKAGSLKSITHINIDLMDFTNRFNAFFTSRITMIPNDDRILEMYNAQLFRRNEISVFQKNDLRQNGIIKKADEHGFLWIDLEQDGLQKFFHKQIELLY